jgi:hypothetical protein
MRHSPMTQGAAGGRLLLDAACCLAPPVQAAPAAPPGPPSCRCLLCAARSRRPRRCAPRPPGAPSSCGGPELRQLLPLPSSAGCCGAALLSGAAALRQLSSLRTGGGGGRVVSWAQAFTASRWAASGCGAACTPRRCTGGGFCVCTTGWGAGAALGRRRRARTWAGVLRRSRLEAPGRRRPWRRRSRGRRAGGRLQQRQGMWVCGCVGGLARRRRMSVQLPRRRSIPTRPLLWAAGPGSGQRGGLAQVVTLPAGAPRAAGRRAKAAAARRSEVATAGRAGEVVPAAAAKAGGVRGGGEWGGWGAAAQGAGQGACGPLAGEGSAGRGPRAAAGAARPVAASSQPGQPSPATGAATPGPRPSPPPTWACQSPRACPQTCRQHAGSPSPGPHQGARLRLWGQGSIHALSLPGLARPDPSPLEWTCEWHSPCWPGRWPHAAGAAPCAPCRQPLLRGTARSRLPPARCTHVVHATRLPQAAAQSGHQPRGAASCAAHQRHHPWRRRRGALAWRRRSGPRRALSCPPAAGRCQLRLSAAAARCQHAGSASPWAGSVLVGAPPG